MGYSLASNTSIWRHSIEAMTKHLPPSSAELRLLDFSTNSGQVTQALHKIRPDIVALEPDPPSLFDGHLGEIETLQHYLQHIAFADNSIDAITAYSTLFLLDEPESFLLEALRVLRPGGRLILFDPSDEVSAWATFRNIFPNPQNAITLFRWHRSMKQHQGFSPERIARILENNGFARILAERAFNGWAILSRGEKPYTANTSTVNRSAIGTSDSDHLGLLHGEEWLAVQGRYIHLLIRQTPNMPVWKAKSSKIEWNTAAISLANKEQPIAFAFTSLPKAVSFMQGAVLEDRRIQNINKIAKFDKYVASRWDFKILLNPTLAVFEEFSSASIVFLAIDPESAEAPDE